jgi:WD40 repeat protein
MSWPTSQDYNEAIQNPKTSFSDTGLKNGEVVVNAIGLPVPRSGNFADVYQYADGDGKTWALKCFTRKVAGLQERYAKIDEHIAKANFPFTVGFKYLAQGVRIRGEWFPLLKMEWVEGFTLNEFVRDNAAKPSYLQALLQMWAKLTARLRDSNFAHADLQHGNVLLVPGDAQNKLGLRLIDYDGMWVPALAEHHSGEIGHPNFQHPFRLRDRLYNLDVDRFPHLVIASALRATMLGGRPLWDRFDNGDNLLFKEADLRDPTAAPVFKALWEMNDDVLCTLVGKMALASREPLRKTPWLDDVLQEEGGPRLTEDEEKKVMALLGVGPHFTAARPAALPLPAEAPATNEFNDFRVDPAKESPRPSGRYEAVKKKRPPTRYEDDEEEAPRKKSLLPLFIGGGVLAAGLLIGVLALALSGGSKPTNASVAKNTDKEDAPRDVVAPPPKRDTTSEPPKKGPPAEIKKDPPAEVKKDPPAEVKNDPPAEVKKDPPAEVKRGPTERPPQLQVNTPTAVVGVVAVPPSRDALIICKDSRSLVRAFSVLGPKPSAIGKHNGAIRAVACASDGTVAVSGGDDNTVRVWSLDDPKQLHALTEHTRPVVACAVSPDDERAISLGADSLLCEWDIRAGKLLGRFEAPGARAVAYLRSGKAVLVGTAAESAVIYDLERKERVRNLPGHKGSVNAVCVSGDGKTAFTAGDDFIIRCWNLETGAEMRTLNRHTAPVFALCLTPDERFLLSAGADNLVCTWDYGAGSLHSSFANPERLRVVSIVAPGDELLVGMGDDIGPGKMLFRHFNITGPPPPAKRPDVRPEDLAELWSNNGAFGQLAFSPDGGKVVAAGFAGSYRTFALRDGASLDNLNISPLSFTGYAMLADGSLLIRNAGKTKGAAGEGYCWDPQTKARRFTIDDDGANFRYVAVAPKANVAAIAQKVGGLAIYSLTDGKKIESYSLPAAGPVHSLSITDDGEAILAHVGSNRICLRPRKGSPFGELAQIDFRSGTIPTVRMSPNGQFYVQYGGNKSTIELYETATGNKLRTLEGHTAKVVDLRFTQDGRRLISIGDSTIRIWDVAAGTEIKQGALAGNSPMQLAVSADGKCAVTTVGPSLKMQFWQLPSENAPPVVKETPPPPPPPKKEPANEVVIVPQLKEACKIEHKLVGKGIAFSGDGNRLLACPASGLDVAVFNTADGARLESLRMPKSCGALAVAADGNLVVASRDGLGVFLFDAASKMRTTNFDVVNNNEMRMTIIARDKSVLLADGRGALGVYALADGKLTASYPIKDQIIGVSSTPDGQDIVVLTAPGDIFIKTAADKTFRLLGNYVKALNVEIAPDGKKILVAYDLAPKVYGVDGKEQVVFDGKAGWVRYAAFLKDGRHAVTIHGNAFMRLWDTETGKQIQQITLPPDSGGYVTVSGDGRFVAAGAGPNAIQIWRIESAAVTVAAPPIVPKKSDAESKDGPSAVSGELLERVTSCFYSSDGKKLYVAVNNGVVHVLDPLTLQETQKFNAVDARLVSAVAAPKSLAAGAKDFIYLLDDQKRLSIFDPEKGAVTRTLSFEAQLSDPNKPPSYNLLVTPDTQMILVLSRSAWRGVSWNLKTGTEVTLTPLQRFSFRNSTHTVAFTPDGKVGAAATTSKLLIWSGKTGLDIATIDCKFTQHLAIVPDANVVASQGSSQFVGYNVLTGKELWNEKLPPFSEGLQAIPKSKRLAFATPTEIVIRECVKGEDTHRWKYAGNGATLLTASSDGKYLVSYSNSERKVSLWAVPAVTPAKKP